VTPPRTDDSIAPGAGREWVLDKTGRLAPKPPPSHRSTRTERRVRASVALRTAIALLRGVIDSPAEGTYGRTRAAIAALRGPAYTLLGYVGEPAAPVVAPSVGSVIEAWQVAEAILARFDVTGGNFNPEYGGLGFSVRHFNAIDTARREIGTALYVARLQAEDGA
jgi:hypothetical protein